MSSLQERLNARLEQLKQDRTFTLPVDGLEEELAASYHVLPYEEQWDLLHQYGAEEDSPEVTLASNADLVIRANVDLLEVKEDGSHQSLGCRWNSGPQVLREKLGIDVQDGASARDAVFAVFAGPQGGQRLNDHAMAYGMEVRKGAPRDSEAVLGELQPSMEGSQN